MGPSITPETAASSPDRYETTLRSQIKDLFKIKSRNDKITVKEKLYSARKKMLTSFEQHFQTESSVCSHYSGDTCNSSANPGSDTYLEDNLPSLNETIQVKMINDSFLTNQSPLKKEKPGIPIRPSRPLTIYGMNEVSDCLPFASFKNEWMSPGYKVISFKSIEGDSEIGVGVLRSLPK